ncbi:MAG: nucleotide sugar dehydrogenase [bacterium]|nr:nucleotide sugar dehydrogenase [bacterium]
MTNLKICIVGPGIVGQATGKAFLAKGFEITFVGVDPKNITDLRHEGYNANLVNEVFNGNYNFDVTFLTVPTPTLDGKIDISALKDASINLGKNLAHSDKYHLVVVKSTVLPGTTENMVIKYIEKYSKKRAGPDFGVCMNPEYLREKTADEDALNPWLILIGEYDKKSGYILSEIYRDFDGPIYRVSITEAEIQKYIHNLFNATKITFFNEMRQIGQKMGINIEKVFNLTSLSAEGVWNHTYGIKDKGPFSGKCLPKDTQAFFSWAEENGFDAKLLKSVIEVNEKIKTKKFFSHQAKSEHERSHLPL